MTTSVTVRYWGPHPLLAAAKLPQLSQAELGQLAKLPAPHSPAITSPLFSSRATAAAAPTMSLFIAWYLVLSIRSKG
jgi:hypothetical protein